MNYPDDPHDDCVHWIGAALSLVTTSNLSPLPQSDAPRLADMINLDLADTEKMIARGHNIKGVASDACYSFPRRSGIASISKPNRGLI